MSSISNHLPKIDYYCDFVPGLSTVSNLVNLILKAGLGLFASEETIKESYYFTHLDQKDVFECVTAMIPVLGNIGHIVVKLFISGPARNAVIEEATKLGMDIGSIPYDLVKAEHAVGAEARKLCTDLYTSLPKHEEKLKEVVEALKAALPNNVSASPSLNRALEAWFQAHRFLDEWEEKTKPTLESLIERLPAEQFEYGDQVYEFDAIVKIRSIKEKAQSASSLSHRVLQQVLLATHTTLHESSLRVILVTLCTSAVKRIAHSNELHGLNRKTLVEMKGFLENLRESFGNEKQRSYLEWEIGRLLDRVERSDYSELFAI